MGRRARYRPPEDVELSTLDELAAALGVKPVVALKMIRRHWYALRGHVHRRNRSIVYDQEVTETLRALLGQEHKTWDRQSDWLAEFLNRKDEHA